MTTLMSLSIRNMPLEHRATAMGVFQAMYAVGMLAGPLVSGIVGEKLGLSAVFSIASLPSFIIVALAFLPVFSKRSTA